MEINKIRGERLRSLLKKYGMEQQELAEKLGYTKEHISYIINGKRNLTQDAAESIVKIFPKTRIGWLLGYEDYETDHDIIGVIAQEMLDNRIAAETLIGFAAKFLGYCIETPNNGDIKKTKETEETIIRDYNPDKVNGYLVKDHIRIEMTESDTDAIIDELVRYAMFLLDGLINKKNDSWHPFWIGREVLDDGKYSRAPGQDR